MKLAPSERRKSKRDKRAKARYGVYKRGGKYRSTKVKLKGSEKAERKK